MSKERDDLIVQRETARTDVASVQTGDPPPRGGHLNEGDARRSWLHPFVDRAPSQPSAAGLNGRNGAHHSAEGTDPLTHSR